MFQGLNEIDWSSMEYHHGVAQDVKDIPKWIQQLLADDRGIRINAIDSLLGHEQHTGMIVRATPQIIPYILEVLALDNYIEKAYLLEKLRSVAFHIFLAGKQITAMKRAIKTGNTPVLRTRKLSPVVLFKLLRAEIA